MYSYKEDEEDQPRQLILPVFKNNETNCPFFIHPGEREREREGGRESKLKFIVRSVQVAVT